MHARSWRELAKCRFAHFPSFFSVHVDTYAKHCYSYRTLTKHCKYVQARQTSGTQKQCSNWKRLSFLIIGHVCMDGTPVDNNRLVLAPFLNTLTVRASPSLSASQYPKDRKSPITTEKTGRLA